MLTNYVLIDFENVQPKNLEILAEHPFKALVFVGARQAKVPFDLAQAMQKLGTNAEYIKIAAIVKNLAARGQSRPRKTKTLTNTINNQSFHQEA